MKYDRLYDDFIDMFPEDLSFFEEMKNETGAGVEDGMHVVFGMIIVPYVRKIIMESPNKAKKAFEFFEEMEKSGDPMIAEVIEFSVLEKILTDDKKMVDEYIKFFGKETKEAASLVGKWYSEK